MKTESTNAEASVEPADAAAELQGLYHQWKDWSIRLKQAVLIDDWIQVSRCQREKEVLKTRISQLSVSHPEQTREIHRSDFARQLRLAEQEIFDLISQKVNESKMKIQQFDNSLSNLRRIQSSYIKPRQSMGLSRTG